MLDPAAGRLDRRRDHVAPIDDDRGAVHQHQLGPGLDGGGDERREIGGCVVAALLGGERRAERRQTLFGDAARLVENAFLQPRQPRLDQRDPPRREGRDPQQRPAFGRERGGARDRVLGHGERDDFDRRDHLARLDDREGRQGAERHRLVDQVEPVEPVAVEHQEAARLGVQIGASGKGRRRRDIRAGDDGGDAVGGLVLAQIARIEPRRDDIGHPRRASAPRYRRR